MMKLKNILMTYIKTMSNIRLKGMYGKMILLATIPVFLMSFGAIFILFNVQTVSKQLTKVLGDTVPAITTSKSFIIEIKNMELNIAKVLYSKDNPDLAQNFIFEFEDSVNRFNSNLERYMKINMPDELVVKLRDDVKAKWLASAPAFEEFKKAMNSKKFNIVAKLYEESIKIKLNEIVNVVSTVELNNTNLIESEKESAKKLAFHVTINSIMIGGLAIFISFIMASIVANKITQQLLLITLHLNEQSEFTQEQSKSMAHASQQLAQDSTQAANAIQQTLTVMTQIKATTHHNSDNAKKTADVSTKSMRNLVASKRTIDETKDSIIEIQKAKEDMCAVVTESNNRMTEILEIIKAIDSKTVMINDIVFQTKLLSFNASVEAARAGESGKGFAVVAEEVGKLAITSGSAASEISALLEESQTKVEAIVTETKKDMAKVTIAIDEKVQDSEKSIQASLALLEQVQENSQNINQLIMNIINSSNEQVKGVDEATRAVDELSIISNRNMEGSQQIATSAGSILEKAQLVTETSAELSSIING